MHIHIHHHPQTPTDAILSKILKNTELILENQTKIMSTISDFAAKQDAHNTAIDAGITGLTGDVTNLNNQIAALKTSLGDTISDDDKATLARLDATGQSLADRLTALDALTPPVVPAEPVAPVA